MQDKTPSRNIAKRIVAAALSSVLLFSAVSSTTLMMQSPLTTVAEAATTIFAKGSTVQTTDNLNLRKTAGGESITVLSKGTKLTVTAKNTGEWVAVKTSDGTTGYVSATYLKSLETLVEYVTTTNLNYRTSPGGKVKDTLAKGTSVNVVSGYSKTVDDIKWYRIKINNTYYYVASTYLKKVTAATGVTLNATKKSLAVGDTATLKATVTPSSASQTVTWSSADKTIAKVSSSGKITAVKEGTVKITAKTSNGKKATCTVTVTAAETLVDYVTTDDLQYRTSPSSSGKAKGTLAKGTIIQIVSGYSKSADGIKWYKMKKDGSYYYVASSYLTKAVAATGITLNTKKKTLSVGDITTLKATITPDNTTDQTVTWSSADKTIAKVSSSGKVTAVKAGTVKITAETSNGVKATCTVTVTADVTKIALDQTSASVGVGSTMTLTPTITPSDATDQTVTWSSDNEDVATVSSDGIVTGGAEGTAKITAETANGLTASCTVTVEEPVAVESIALNKTTATVTAGSAVTLKATITPSDATDQTVTWSSADKTIATVSSAGKVTGVKEGTVKITAKTANGKKATCTVTVEASNETLVNYTCTGTSVRYRTSPDEKDDKVIKGFLALGEVVAVVCDKDGTPISVEGDDVTWYQIKKSGSYYYVSSSYLKKATTTTTTTTTTVTTVSETDVSMQKLKTLYLTGLSSGTWKSSDTSVATVVNGFVYGVKAGTATITCTSGTKKMVWNVTVKSAAPVKFAYATPNVVSAGSKVTFVAVTDTARNSVQFEVNGKTVLVTDYTTETTAATTTGFAKTTSRIWKYTTSFPEAGTYTATIRSSAKADGSSMSSSYLTTDAFVVSTQNTTTSSVEARRISDEGLEVIASWEGYAAAVYLDPLTSTVVPTVGYGYTFSSGASFYNNLTKTEAWALLCSVVNNGNYTKQVNEFITKNNIRANQCQFDAMVSFSYNIGSGYWNGTAAFDLRLLLFNSVNPNSVQAKIDAGEKVTGTTSLKTTVYSSESRSSKTTATLDAGTSVTIKAATWDSTNKAAWYKITTGSVTGYVPASYISITSHTFAKNLNYTDAISFGSEILEWHHAGGGTCYAGLVYRRLGEAKLFSFGKYDAAKNNSSEKGKNTYNYIVPSCISSKGWLT